MRVSERETRAKLAAGQTNVWTGKHTRLARVRFVAEIPKGGWESAPRGLRTRASHKTRFVHPRPVVMEDDASGQPSDTPWSRLTDGARTWDAGVWTPDSTVSPDLRGSYDTIFRQFISLMGVRDFPAIATNPIVDSPSHPCEDKHRPNHHA